VVNGSFPTPPHPPLSHLHEVPAGEAATYNRNFHSSLVKHLWTRNGCRGFTPSPLCPFTYYTAGLSTRMQGPNSGRLARQYREVQTSSQTCNTAAEWV